MRGALCEQDLDEGVRDSAAQAIRSAFSCGGGQGNEEGHGRERERERGPYDLKMVCPALRIHVSAIDIIAKYIGVVTF